MAVTLYTFEKLCDAGRLSSEIKAEAAITIGEDHIETISSPPTTKVYMKDALSSEEEDALEALVTAHVNEPLPDTSPRVITTGHKDPVFNREVFAVSAFAVNTDYEVKATGFKGTASGSSTTSIDHAIGAEDRYINGIELLAQGATMGDTADLQIIDKDGVLEGIAYPPGTPLPVVLKQFGFNWNIDPEKVKQGPTVFNYLARIPAGLYVRVKYTALGESTVAVACNLYLHKKTAI